MAEKSVPAPALSSDALDKSRRNTLLWSALAVASELAQTTKHEIKSSTIGSEAALPVAMVSLIFLLLSAFHLYAFWIEKRRIERWQSKYAREHTGITLREKITALYEQLPGLLLRVNKDNLSTLSVVDRIDVLIGQVEGQSQAIVSYYKSVNTRDKELTEAMKTARHVDDSGPQAVMSKFFHLNSGPPQPVDFELISNETGQLRVSLGRESGPDDELRAKLDKVTKDLSSLADDIEVGERRHFYWYEVGAPVAAFVGATLLWLAATVWPAVPLHVREFF